MKERRLKAEEFLLKYVISYILVLALPLCALFLFSYNQAIRMTQENMRMTQENGLLQLQSLIDADVRNVRDIIQDMRLNQIMQNFHLTQSGYNYIPAVRRLREYTSYNKLLTSMVYYEKGTPYLVSENGTIPLRYFGDELYEWSSIQQKELMELLNGLEEIWGFQDTVKVPNMSSQDYMIYCVPLSGMDAEKEVVLAFLNLNRMEEVIYRAVDSKSVYLLIEDQYGNTIWESGVFKGSGDEKTVKKYVHYSEETGWKYQGVIDVGEASEAIEQLKGRYFAILVALLLIGSMAIYLFLCANYRPIQKLKRQVQELVDDLDIKNLNEVETIQQAVIVLSDTLELETKKIRDMEPLLEKYALSRLLLGLPYEENRLPRCMRGEDGNKCYLISCLSSADGLEAGRLNSLLNRIGVPEFWGVILEPPFIMEPIAVMCFESGQILRITELLEELANRFWKEGKKQINFYLSDPRNSKTDLKSALFEAVITRNLSTVKTGEHIVLYSELLSEKKADKDCLDEFMHRLEMSILSKDTDAILMLAERFRKEGETVVSLRRIADVLLSLKAIAGRSIEDAGIVRRINYKLMQGLETVLCERTGKKWGDVCYEYCLDMVQIVAHSEGKERDGVRMELLLQYLEHYALDEDFSLAAMAEEFQVSPSWLSNYFSKNMHMTLIGYVNQMKMNAAKEMLAYSDMDLEEMTRKLGYGSTSSFIRSFKNIVGMTPGKYRKMAERKAKDEGKEDFYGER